MVKSNSYPLTSITYPSSLASTLHNSNDSDLLLLKNKIYHKNSVHTIDPVIPYSVKPLTNNELDNLYNSLHNNKNRSTYYNHEKEQQQEQQQQNNIHTNVSENNNYYNSSSEPFDESEDNNEEYNTEEDDMNETTMLDNITNITSKDSFKLPKRVHPKLSDIKASKKLYNINSNTVRGLDSNKNLIYNKNYENKRKYIKDQKSIIKNRKFRIQRKKISLVVRNSNGITNDRII
jgi:hypothetical protein